MDKVFPMKKLLSCFLMICLIFTCLPAVSAQELDASAAKDISGTDIVTASEGFPSLSKLFDGKLLEGKAANENAYLTLEHPDGIGSLYFLFDVTAGSYTITDNHSGESRTAGENGFLHDFVDLQVLFSTVPTSVTVTFPGPVTLYELYVYTPGEVPDTVQKWQVPADGATDLVLFSTHGDDEQLFFAGVLPYYAGELGYQVQVVYMTDHRIKDPHRLHEMLNGLWAVGVSAYPVAADYPDFILRYNMEGTYARYKSMGITRDEMLAYVVENLRRFKPLVAVGHDIQGEYGHGMHMVYTDLLMEAITIANDPSCFPESADQYGLWDTPKIYLHMYEENEIIMYWDTPLERFGGMTAFEVTRDIGYPCHASQYSDFAWYHLYFDKAIDCPKYNPCYYGLYRSTVGEDVEKNDFFENLTTYAEQARIAEEEARIAAEEEARRLEEEARLAEEQRLKEEAARQESEAAAREEAARQESIAQEQAQQQAAEAATAQKKKLIWLGLDAVLILTLIVLLVIRVSKKRIK